MYDIAIIGTGPAGISAALTLKSLNVNFIWFGSKNLSMKINKAELIRNYPGLSNASGNDLRDAFLKQIYDMDIKITDKTVTGIYDMSGHYGLLCNQDMYEAKAIILATGVETSKPIKGEVENLGTGVSYCATCDGFLYKNKEITVVSFDKEFEAEIEYLADIASKVYLFPLYKDKSVSKDNLEVMSGSIKEIIKQDKKINLKLNNDELICDGVFVLKSAISPTVLVPGIEALDGHVIIDRQCNTNLKGCFACGDITGRPYQYVKAAGEGNVAAHSAYKYIKEVKE